ncbi:hypothetical protein H0H92_004528 [Tricholoma furcatifolium]|nr:hypothetical protein H0H92_004528 [Tricholoma furcatifolium]
MFFKGFCEDEDVVEVHAHHALRDEVAEDVVHHGLEGGGAIGKAKEHGEQFEQSLIGPEGCLSLITLLDAHIVVTSANVQLGEVAGTTELILLFERKRIDLAAGGFSVGNQFDGMVPLLVLEEGVKRGFGEHVFEVMEIVGYGVSETGDGEDRLLGVVSIVEDAFDDILNGASFVQGAVNVVDRNGTGERASGEPVMFHISHVHEETGGATVQESSNLLYTLSVYGLYLNI